jgi:hypothetical protein
MNFITTQQKQPNAQIEGLRIETGGSVMLSPLVETIPSDTQQPSNMKVLYVFSGVITALCVGTAIGWVLNAHFAQVAKEKAELAASAAKFDLQRNQAQIDNFCLENSSLVKK